MRQQLKRLENRTHRDDSRLTMKSQLIAIVAAVLVVGCGGPSVPDISIHRAAGLGDIEAVKQHLDAGTDVNAKNEWGGTPLRFAAREDHLGSNKEMVELLMAKGADVNAKEKGGETPLHVVVTAAAAAASMYSRKEIAELLIASGADVNAKGDDGKTPLDWAETVFGHRRSIDTIEANKKELADLLRKHGGKTSEELKAEGK